MYLVASFVTDCTWYSLSVA